MGEIVLIVAAHQDDEVLGCGGTILKHVAASDEVYVIFIADGVSSRNKVNPSDIAERNSASENARLILGIRESFYLDLPDNRLDSMPLIEIVKQLELIICKLKPTIVYTHHYGDLNIDHRITHQAVMTACRPLPGSSISEIYTFEVPSSTEWSSHGLAPFLPNHFVEVTSFLDGKIQALEAYALEMRLAPHSRSYEHSRAMAQHRGHSVGVLFAEAFMVMRILRRAI
jgi:N-acetylglucosamine malate deacetylase 1